MNIERFSYLVFFVHQISLVAKKDAMKIQLAIILILRLLNGVSSKKSQSIVPAITTHKMAPTKKKILKTTKMIRCSKNLSQTAFKENLLLNSIPSLVRTVSDKNLLLSSNITEIANPTIHAKRKNKKAAKIIGIIVSKMNPNTLCL